MRGNSLGRAGQVVDPDDISHAWAYTPDREKRQLLCRLDPNEFIEPYTNADDAREAIAEKRREQAVMHKAARASAQRTKTMCKRMAEHAREKRTELMATGTDDKHPQPRIQVVQTGFVGVSKSSRSGFETRPYRPPDVGDVEQLFDSEERIGPVGDADSDVQDMEALHIDDDVDHEHEEGLDALA